MSKADLQTALKESQQKLNEANEKLKNAEAQVSQLQRQVELTQRMAERAEGEANRQRYISVAKAMALKSLELSFDPELEGLMAQTAYNFNKKYGGNPLDNDIYAGLNTALINLKEPSLQSFGAGILALAAGENYLISGGIDGSILSWKQENGNWRSEPVANARKTTAVKSLTINKSLLLAVADKGTQGSIIELYDLQNRKVKPRIFPSSVSIRSACYSPANKVIYALTNSGKEILLFDSTGTKTMLSPEKINSIAIDEEGNHLAAAGLTSVFVWDLRTNFSAAKIFSGNVPLTQIVFSPDGQRIVVGDQSGVVRVVQLSSSLQRVLTGHRGRIMNIVFAPSGKFLATVGDDSSVRLWSWSQITMPPIVIRKSEVGIPSSVVFSLPGDQILMAVPQAPLNKSIQTAFTDPAAMSDKICGLVTRNMTADEWVNVVGPDLKYERTCETFPANKK